VISGLETQRRQFVCTFRGGSCPYLCLLEEVTPEDQTVDEANRRNMAHYYRDQLRQIQRRRGRGNLTTRELRNLQRLGLIEPAQRFVKPRLTGVAEQLLTQIEEGDSP